MKVFIFLTGYILATVAQHGNSLSDLNNIVICASLNNVNRTFDNIWQVYNEFKSTGQVWTPVATGACAVNNVDCTILNPVCAVSSNNFFKTFPNQCVLEAEEKATGTAWNIVFNGICSANPGDGFVTSTSAPPVTPAPAPWFAGYHGNTQPGQLSPGQPALPAPSTSPTYTATSLPNNQQPAYTGFESTSDNQNIAQPANAVSFVYCLPSSSSSSGPISAPVTHYNPACVAVSNPFPSATYNAPDSSISPLFIPPLSGSPGSNPQSIPFNTVSLTNPALSQIFSTPSTAPTSPYTTPDVSAPSTSYSIASATPTAPSPSYNPLSDQASVSVKSYSTPSEAVPSPAPGHYNPVPAPLTSPTYPEHSSNPVPLPIPDQAQVPSYSAPASDVGPSPATGNYNPVPSPISSPPYSSSNPPPLTIPGHINPIPVPAPSSSYSTSSSNVVPSPASEHYNSGPAPSPNASDYNKTPSFNVAPGQYIPAVAPSSSYQASVDNNISPALTSPAYSAPSSNPVPPSIPNRYDPVLSPSSAYSPSSADSVPSQYDQAAAQAASPSYSSSLSNQVPSIITDQYNAVPEPCPSSSDVTSSSAPGIYSPAQSPLLSPPYFAPSSNPAPSPIPDQYNPAPSTTYSSPSLDAVPSPAPGPYTLVKTPQPSPPYSAPSPSADPSSIPGDYNKTPSSDAAPEHYIPAPASSSAYPATADNNLSPAPSYAAILSDPVPPCLPSASAPVSTLTTNLESITFNTVPLTNPALFKIFSPSTVDPAQSVYSPPATSVPSLKYSAPSLDPLPPLPSQPYPADTSDQSSAYINSDSSPSQQASVSYVPSSLPALPAPDYTSPAVSIPGSVSQYSKGSETNSLSISNLQQSDYGKAPYGKSDSSLSPLRLPVPLTPTVANVQYPTSELSFTNASPSDAYSAPNKYAQQPETQEIPCGNTDSLYDASPIASVQQSEDNYQKPGNSYSTPSDESYGSKPTDIPAPPQSYQPPSSSLLPAASISNQYNSAPSDVFPKPDEDYVPLDAACSNAEIYTSPVLNYENLPSYAANSNDVPATSDNFGDKPNDSYNNNVNEYDQDNSKPAVLYDNTKPYKDATADNSNKNANTEAQTIYNGVVYQGPYYYEPKYKHINYGNFNFLPAQNSAAGVVTPVPPSAPALVPTYPYAATSGAQYTGYSTNPFEQLLKQLQFIATRNVTSGY